MLFVLAPSVAAQITRTTDDATLRFLYGHYTLTFAYVSFMAARANDAAGKLSLTILLFTAGHVVVFG